MTTLFFGDVQLYLQGKNALFITSAPGSNPITYYVGSKRTKLHITDYREQAINAANKFMAGEIRNSFVDYFNSPALAEVHTDDKKEQVEIVLREHKVPKSSLILWLGVTNNHRLPNFDTKWEFLRPISSKRTAFLSLVKDGN